MAARRVTDEQLEMITTLREKGRGYDVIGAEVGLSRSAVSWHCLRLGVDPPKPTALRAPPESASPINRGAHLVRPYTQAEDEQLLALEASGLNINQIAQAMGRRWNSTRGRLMTLARHDARREG